MSNLLSEVNGKCTSGAAELNATKLDYEKLIELSTDVICTLDAQGRFLKTSVAVTQLWGYTQEEIIGMHYMDLVVEEDHADTISIANDVMEGACVINFENRFRRRDEGIVWLSWSARWDRDTQIMYAVARDITRQKEAERLLQQSEQRFKRMVQSGQDLIALVDESFRLIYMSPNLEQVTGYAPGEVQDMLAHNYVHPDDYPLILAETQKILTSEIVHIPYYRFRVKDGSYKWFEATLSNFLNDEDINAIVCNVRDVSRRKAALDKVMKLSAVVRETTNSVIITDASGHVEWVNPAFTQRTGYSLYEVTGTYALNLLNNSENSPFLRNEIKECMRNKEPFTGEVVSVSKDGRKHWVELKAQTILDERGNVQNYFTIQLDISARKAAEEALRLSEKRYKLLFYQSPTPKWIYHSQTYQIVDVNDAACKLYGYSRAEFLELKIPDLKLAEDKELFYKQVQETLQSESTSFHDVVRHIKKKGEVFYVDISTHAIDISSCVHFIVSVYDLTERMAAQKEITKATIQAQENERSLISKELHDNVNQILTAAKLSIENTWYYPEHRETFILRGVAMIQEAIREIRTLCKTLVSPALYESGLKVAVLEMLDQYRNLQRFEITEELDFDEDAIDNELKLTIYRIIQELINNTVKYAEASMVSIWIAQEDNSLSIVTYDNGKGFDPSAKSSGLGLNNIKSRVELFKGTVSFDSAPGKGCITTILFPV